MKSHNDEAQRTTVARRRKRGLLSLLIVAVSVQTVGCSDSTSSSSLTTEKGAQRPNVLLIVADDLNWNSVGAFGCEIPDLTPNIDRLASQGMRFEQAHVTVSVCQPSRSTLLTGRYPHRCGGEGFYPLRLPDVPLLPGVLREAGYRVGVMGKLKHSTPYEDFEWDFAIPRVELGMGRNPKLFAKAARQFIEESKRVGVPFFLMANSHDPHRPFFGADPESFYDRDRAPALPPSKRFTSVQCPVPGFLPDLSAISEEITSYYNSVRRLDDTVGALLRTLKRTGVAKETIVVFLSDNGMSFPFAKASCYLNSTRTPWIVRWPGQVAHGSACQQEMISAIDLMPTLLEVTGVEAPAGMDGRSIVELLRGASQSGRELVFTQYGQKSNGENFPMRCVQSQRYGYIFNLWSNGERSFKPGELALNQTFDAMTEAASTDVMVSNRLDYLLKRTPEEFYDFAQDPDALHNLIDDPAYAEPLAMMRKELEAWMERYGDIALGAFLVRESPEALERYVAEHYPDEQSDQ